MSELLVAFSVMFAGSVFVGIVARWVRSRHEPVQIDALAEAEKIYSRRHVALLCAAAIFGAWMAILWIDLASFPRTPTYVAMRLACASTGD